MSGWMEDTKMRSHATAWWVWGFALVVLTTLAWVFIINPLLVSKKAETLQDSYGAQNAKIAGARNSIIGAETATGKGQKAALINNACALIAEISEKPADIASWAAKEC